MSWYKGVQVWIVPLSAGLQCNLLLILSILSTEGHGLCPKGACKYNSLKINFDVSRMDPDPDPDPDPE
jgi:hypothetical protein